MQVCHTLTLTSFMISFDIISTNIIKFKMKISIYLINSLILLILNLFVCDITNAQRSEWNYENQIHWDRDFPECSGTLQSPINIPLGDVKNASLKIDFHNYDFISPNFRVNNTGHTIQFTYNGEPSTAPAISGSALKGYRYSLAQLHFHWGQKNGLGSEHAFNGEKYEMELHLVHFNMDKYDNFDDALHAPDGVAVLALFYMTHDQNEEEFENIVEMVNDVAELGGNVTIQLKHPLDLVDLLPHLKDNMDVFRYTGSLTTPPCTEGINWLVMDAFGFIGQEQMEAFRAVKDIQHNTLEGNNYRASQPLFGRAIERFHLCWSTRENGTNSLVRYQNGTLTYCIEEETMSSSGWTQVVSILTFSVLFTHLFW